MIDFLKDILPAPNAGEVFVTGTLKQLSGRDVKVMTHQYAETHARLAVILTNFDNDSQDTYFALARYNPHKSKSGKSPGRQGEHVRAVKSFWLDLDCGEDKATAGDGYATKKQASEALSAFLEVNSLILPSHVVDSGGGIHVYFALTEEIPPEKWNPVADKLKKLCDTHGFLADKSRTNDIASVLRPPGTHNYKPKYGTPRPVKIKYTGALISFAEFAGAIDSALEKYDVNCKLMSRIPSLVYPADGNTGAEYGPPDIDKLQSALSVLDPDCEEPTWKLHRIAPLVLAAKQHPELHDQLKELGRQWSRGDLYTEATHDR